MLRWRPIASLVAALARGDAKAVASLLDEQFNWIDGSGRVLTKDQIGGMKPLLGDEKGLKPIVHSYGDVVTVVVEGDKQYLLRIWGKRAGRLAPAGLSRGVAGRAGVRARPGQEGMGQSLLHIAL